MPELPEVETVVKGLNSVVLAKKVKAVHFYREDLRWRIPIEIVKEVLVGQKIDCVSRRSKYIVIQTKRGYCLSHLGMTGNFLFLEGLKSVHQHTHFIIEIQDSTKHLHYVDPRRFGILTAKIGNDWEQDPLLSKLGPEPLKKRKLAQYLFDQAIGRSTPVKSYLMNPHNIVGIGNIYACEILFKSRISPFTEARTLSLEQWEIVAKYIRVVLRKAIQTGGSSIRDFHLVDGSSGYFAIDFDVYGRAGQACKVCKSDIEVQKLSGRSTFFCRFCQKEN